MTPPGSHLPHSPARHPSAIHHPLGAADRPHPARPPSCRPTATAAPGIPSSSTDRCHPARRSSPRPPTTARPALTDTTRPFSTSPHTAWLPSDRHTHDPRDQPPPVRPPPDSSHPGPLDRSHPIGSHRTHVHGSHGPSPHQSDIRPSDICHAGIHSHAWGHPRDIPPGIVRPRLACGVPVRSPVMIYLPASVAVASRSPPELPIRPHPPRAPNAYRHAPGRSGASHVVTASGVRSVWTHTTHNDHPGDFHVINSVPTRSAGGHRGNATWMHSRWDTS